jgi:cytochrome b561
MTTVLAATGEAPLANSPGALPTDLLRALPGELPDDLPGALRTKRRIPPRLMLDIVVDVALLIAFIIDSNTQLTGIPVHEWLGLAFGIGFVVHLALHWDWVMRTARQIFSSAPVRERIKWSVDIALYVMLGAAVVSGWYISRHAAPAFGVARIDETFFRGLHSTTADLSVLLVAVHLGLNWRWMRATWIRATRSRGAARGVESQA